MTALDMQIIEKRQCEKHCWTYVDIMQRYGVGVNKAYAIIRSIRAACGGGKLGSGKVLPAEVEYWESDVNKKVVRRL